MTHAGGAHAPIGDPDAAAEPRALAASARRAPWRSPAGIPVPAILFPLAGLAAGLLTTSCGREGAPRAAPRYGPVVLELAREAGVVEDGGEGHEGGAREGAGPGKEDPMRVTGLLEAFEHGGASMQAKALRSLLSLDGASLALVGEWILDASRPIGPRAELVQSLVPAESTTVTDLLLHILAEGREEDLRISAAWALGKRAEDRVIPELVEKQKRDASPIVQVYAAVALAEHGSRFGIPYLHEALAGKAWGGKRVVQAAVDAVAGWLEEEVSDPARAREILDRHLASMPPGPAGEPSAVLRREIVRRIRDLGEFQLGTVDGARWVLEALGPMAVPDLTLVLHDENRYVRHHAAEVLGRIGKAAAPAVGELIALAADPIHRAAVVETLGRVRDDGATSYVVSCLDDPDPSVRAAAVEALGGLGPRETVVPALAGVLERLLSGGAGDAGAGGVTVEGRPAGAGGATGNGRTAGSGGTPVDGRSSGDRSGLIAACAESLARHGEERGIGPLLRLAADRGPDEAPILWYAIRSIASLDPPFAVALRPIAAAANAASRRAAIRDWFRERGGAAAGRGQARK